MSRGPGRGVAEAGQRTPSVVTVTRSHEKRFPAAGAGLGWAGQGWAGPGRAGVMAPHSRLIYLPPRRAGPATDTRYIHVGTIFTCII